MAQGAVTIKGTRQGLQIWVDPTVEFEDLKASLKKQIESAGGFFQGAKVTHIINPVLSSHQCQELEDLLASHGLVTTGIRTGPSLQDSSQRGQGDPMARMPVKPLQQGEVEERCLFVQNGLRSGQRVEFDGTVVVLGDVNPGAEIIATGNLLVMGALKGVVHAGAAGNREAVVTAFRLEPSQIRIADVVARPPDKPVPPSGPETAMLEGNGIVVSPYPGAAGGRKPRV